MGKDDCEWKVWECAGAGAGDLRSHNLASPQDSLSVGALLTVESIDVLVGPIFLPFKIKTITTGCIKPSVFIFEQRGFP
jgi:hypothetical protein